MTREMQTQKEENKRLQDELEVSTSLLRSKDEEQKRMAERIRTLSEQMRERLKEFSIAVTWKEGEGLEGSVNALQQGLSALHTFASDGIKKRKRLQDECSRMEESLQKEVFYIYMRCILTMVLIKSTATALGTARTNHQRVLEAGKGQTSGRVQGQDRTAPTVASRCASAARPDDSTAAYGLQRCQ